MTWASESDVVTLTGSPADAVKLAQAQATIELAIGRTEAKGTAEMTARDLDWLRRAVAYQAAWMAGQPDLFQRLEVKSLSQDGMSATFKGDALVLAPNAKRAIRNLSWLGSTRSVSVEPFCPTPARRLVDYENEPWRPL
jgi:hypothetical protein